MSLFRLLPLMTRTFWSTLHSMWGPMGGALVTFNTAKFYLLGKQFRIVEYPNMERIHTMKLRFHTLDSLKVAIAQSADIENGEEVIYLARFSAPHFTEPITDNKGVRTIDENGWLIWSRAEPIPIVGLRLEKGAMAPTISHVLRQLAKLTDEGLLTLEEEERLVDLALNGEKGVLALTSAFESTPERLRHHVRRRYLCDQHKLPDTVSSTSRPLPESQ